MCALVHSGPTARLSYGGRRFWVLCDAGESSLVTCHMSRVTCHMSFFSFFFLVKKSKNLKKMDKVVELVGGGSVINGAYPSSF